MISASVELCETVAFLAQGHFLLKLLVVNTGGAGFCLRCSDYCILVRRRVMPRKGWSSLETPAGWYQVIRGPRPKAAPEQQWRCSSSWWQHGQWPVAKSEKPKVQRRWQRGPVTRGTNPDEAMAAARTKVQRLERAIEALGDNESTETKWLVSALKEARRAAQERPTAVQVEECQAFIQRSQNRLLRTEQHRIAEQKELDAAMLQLTRLRRDEQSGVSSRTASASRSLVDRASRIASPRRRDGGGEGRVPQEAHKIPFRPFTRHARSLGAKCCVVPASSKRQICSNGDIDRSRRDHRWKFASFQPVELKDLCSRTVNPRYGFRGVRVGSPRSCEQTTSDSTTKGFAATVGQRLWFR